MSDNAAAMQVETYVREGEHSTRKPPRRRRRLRPLLTVLAGLAFAAAGCGGDEDAGDAAADQDAAPKTVKVGALPVVESAPLYIGIEQGIFEEEGLKVEPQINTGGAAVTAAVVSGAVDIGFSNPTSLVLARANGIDLKIIAPASAAAADESDASVWIVSKEGNGIDEPSDLEGKKIAVNQLGNILEITTKESLSEAGVDIGKIALVEVPFPEMPAALDAGRIDAFVSVEPFVTQALQADGQRVFNPYERVLPGLSTADYFVTAEYLSENQEVVEAFQRGIKRATEYANANPDAVKAIVPTYTQLTPEVVEQIRLPVLVSELDPTKYQPHIDLSRKYGLMDADVQLEELLAPSVGGQ